MIENNSLSEFLDNSGYLTLEEDMSTPLSKSYIINEGLFDGDGLKGFFSNFSFSTSFSDWQQEAKDEAEWRNNQKKALEDKKKEVLKNKKELKTKLRRARKEIKNENKKQKMQEKINLFKAKIKEVDEQKKACINAIKKYGSVGDQDLDMYIQSVNAKAGNVETGEDANKYQTQAEDMAMYIYRLPTDENGEPIEGAAPINVAHEAQEALKKALKSDNPAEEIQKLKESGMFGNPIPESVEGALDRYKDRTTPMADADIDADEGFKEVSKACVTAACNENFKRNYGKSHSEEETEAKLKEYQEIGRQAAQEQLNSDPTQVDKIIEENTDKKAANDAKKEALNTLKTSTEVKEYASSKKVSDVLAGINTDEGSSAISKQDLLSKINLDNEEERKALCEALGVEKIEDIDDPIQPAALAQSKKKASDNAKAKMQTITETYKDELESLGMINPETGEIQTPNKQKDGKDEVDDEGNPIKEEFTPEFLGKKVDEKNKALDAENEKIEKEQKELEKSRLNNEALTGFLKSGTNPMRQKSLESMANEYHIDLEEIKHPEDDPATQKKRAEIAEKFKKGDITPDDARRMTAKLEQDVNCERLKAMGDFDPNAVSYNSKLGKYQKKTVDASGKVVYTDMTDEEVKAFITQSAQREQLEAWRKNQEFVDKATGDTYYIDEKGRRMCKSKDGSVKEVDKEKFEKKYDHNKLSAENVEDISQKELEQQILDGTVTEYEDEDDVRADDEETTAVAADGTKIIKKKDGTYAKIDKDGKETKASEDDFKSTKEKEGRKEPQDPAKVWKPKTYKRGDKTLQTKSLYNNKGDSISQDEFKKKQEVYKEKKAKWDEEQKNGKDSGKGTDNNDYYMSPEEMKRFLFEDLSGAGDGASLECPPIKSLSELLFEYLYL